MELMSSCFAWVSVDAGVTGFWTQWRPCWSLLPTTCGLCSVREVGENTEGQL